MPPLPLTALVSSSTCLQVLRVHLAGVGTLSLPTEPWHDADVGEPLQRQGRKRRPPTMFVPEKEEEPVRQRQKTVPKARPPAPAPKAPAPKAPRNPRAKSEDENAAQMSLLQRQLREQQKQMLHLQEMLIGTMQPALMQPAGASASAARAAPRRRVAPRKKITAAERAEQMERATEITELRLAQVRAARSALGSARDPSDSETCDDTSSVAAAPNGDDDLGADYGGTEEECWLEWDVDEW